MTNGIKIMYVKDDAEYIQESMKEVEFTILLTGLIVVIIIYLFLGDAMATLVPCVTIPVSLIGTFFALKAMGMSINLLTLFAMVLAVGVVVDDAIVVIENVKRHIEEGKSAVIATQLNDGGSRFFSCCNGNGFDGSICADYIYGRYDWSYV